MTCVLCRQAIDLFELDSQGWMGEPAHGTCAQAARDALDEAIDEIARRHRERNDRLGKRYQTHVA